MGIHNYRDYGIFVIFKLGLFVMIYIWVPSYCKTDGEEKISHFGEIQVLFPNPPTFAVNWCSYYLPSSKSLDFAFFLFNFYYSPFYLAFAHQIIRKDKVKGNIAAQYVTSKGCTNMNITFLLQNYVFLHHLFRRDFPLGIACLLCKALTWKKVTMQDKCDIPILLEVYQPQ